ncbi:MAG: translation elongation factor Ts [Polyangiaceae bacterium]|jgi:elongation factor Ts|nr:translation elongation factor Ts [Polyangiaceae bacterium]
MATVTPQLIRELRERTQAGMADCKNALVEAEGDVEKAVEIILKKGLAKSAKRAGAVATEGEIRATISDDGRFGVLVEVNIQTDFAARNDKFQQFLTDVRTLASQVRSHTELLEARIPSTGKTVAVTRDELIAMIGEKIDVRRFARIELAAPAGRVHSYVHLNGKIGVLLEVAAATDAVAQHEAFLKFVDDTAMQIAAMSPVYLDSKQVPQVEIDRQTEIFSEQVKGEGKPEKAWPKIVDGKLSKWYTEVCLVDQNSVIENGKSVDQVRAEAAQAAGGAIKLLSFVRFQLGEGLARKDDDFAQEAQKMAGV